MKVGDQVEVVRKGRVLFDGVLTKYEDDSGEYIANVEEWATIKHEDGTSLVFRRPDCFDGYEGGWTAKSKVKARKWGTVSIRVAASRSAAARTEQGE